MNKVLNPNKAEIRLAKSYAERKAIIDEYKNEGYEVPPMNEIMKSQIRSIIEVVDTYKHSVELTAIEDDAIIDEQEKADIEAFNHAVEAFKEAMKNIINK